MNHKTFTQIPDKTNVMIFLKSAEKHVFGPFLVIFARWGLFPKNKNLSNTTLHCP